MWSFNDPREVLPDLKRFNIVIVRPVSNGFEASVAEVDIKHTYRIFTDFKDFKVVENWNKDWKWTRLD